MEMVQILFSNLVNLSEEEADQYHYKVIMVLQFY